MVLIPFYWLSSRHYYDPSSRQQPPLIYMCTSQKPGVGVPSHSRGIVFELRSGCTTTSHSGSFELAQPVRPERLGCVLLRWDGILTHPTRWSPDGGRSHLSLSMLSLDLHIVISHLYVEFIRREVLHIHEDRELVPVGPHLER